MDSDLTDLDDVLASIVETGPKESSPGAWYSKDGDCVFCFSEDVEYFAERVDRIITVYYAKADRRIVGVQIKHISRLPKYDIMEVAVDSDGKFDVVHLVLISLKTRETSEVPPDRAVKYLDSLQSVRGNRINRDELQLVN